jgi:hypothetical protein
VGAGEDEGGSEGDLTRFERDRIRTRIAEEQLFLETIDAALERSPAERGWKQCTKCGEADRRRPPRGAARHGPVRDLQGRPRQCLVTWQRDPVTSRASGRCP